MKERTITTSIISAALVFFAFFFFSTQTAHAQFSGGLSGLGQGIGRAALSCKTGTNTLDTEMGASEQGSGPVEVTDADTKKIEKKESCKDAIANFLVQQMLAQITQETVNWINSGFKGNPTFLRDPYTYITSITREAQTELVGLISQDSVNHPFGRDAARSLIQVQLNNNFASRSQYSLNRLLNGANQAQFYGNFRIGGWEAFLSQNLNYQNNPIDYQAAVFAEESRRTAGGESVGSKVQQAIFDLQNNGGFLSLKVCARSEADNGEYYPPEVVDGERISEAEYMALAAMAINMGNEALAQQHLSHVCEVWETQTPGSVISHRLNKALDIGQDKLVASDEFQESLDAIFNALLNQVFQNGIANLEQIENEANNALDSIGLGFLLDPTELLNSASSGAEQFFGGLGVNTADIDLVNGSLEAWNQQEPVNIIEELPYRIYLQKKYLGVPGIEPPEGFEDPAPLFGGAPEFNEALTTTVLALEELDFCIPGPNPRYQERIYDRLAQAEERIAREAETASSVSNLLSPSGMAAGRVAENQIRAVNALRTAAQDYINKIENKFKVTPGNMPYVTTAAYQQIRKIEGYMQRIQENEVRMNEIGALIGSLENLQQRIQDLVDGVTNGTIPEEEATMRGELLVRTFYTAAQSLVDEEDIIDLQNAASNALGQIATIESYTQQCVDDREDPNYTGQVNVVPYQSINGTVMQFYQGQSSGSVAYFLTPVEDLDYQLNAGAIIGQITGSLSGYTVLETLDWFGISMFDEFSSRAGNSSWFQDFVGIQ
jgi:hypothetical protein